MNLLNITPNYIPEWQKKFMSVLSEDEKDYMVHALEKTNLNELEKETLFNIYCEAVVRLRLCSRDNAAKYIARAIPLFNEIQSESDKVSIDEGRHIYIKLKQSLDENAKKRKQWVKEKEDAIKEKWQGELMK